MKRISKLSVKKTYKILKQNIMKNWKIKRILKLFSCYTNCQIDTMERNMKNYLFFYMIV